MTFSVQKVPTSDEVITSGAISITFDEGAQTITRSSGSFVSDGFLVDESITTDATLNPGPFTISDVQETVITVYYGIVDEGPVTKTITCDRTTWTPSTGGNNYALIDEYPTPSDLDYNGVSYSGFSDNFGYTAFAIATDQGYIITNVKVYLRGKSNNSTAKIAARIKVNGTWYAGTAVNFTTSYSDVAFLWETNPDTGLAWTVADVNGTGANPLQEFGYISSGGTETNRRVSMAYIESNYGNGEFECDMDDDPLVLTMAMTGAGTAGSGTTFPGKQTSPYPYL